MFEIIFLSDITDFQFICVYMNIVSIAKVTFSGVPSVSVELVKVVVPKPSYYSTIRLITIVFRLLQHLVILIVTQLN